MNINRSFVAWLISASLFFSFAACRPVDQSYPDLEQITIAYASSLTQEEIATSLFSKYLAAHSSWQVPRADRISAYQIDTVDVQEDFSNGFQFRVNFSVCPTARESNWIAGNGRMDGAWIEDKSLFVTVEHIGEVYSITGMGTGP